MSIDEPDQKEVGREASRAEKRIDERIAHDLAEIEKDSREIAHLEEEKHHLHNHHHEHHHPELVTITVDNKAKEVARGEYVVSVLKEKVDVPANYELEQVKEGTLVPLDDNAKVPICGGEVFVSHVRRGGSSHAE